jgi:hypothetical protein
VRVVPDDPFHFGDLGSAMLTLFRIATQEDWTDIMYFNMFGCDKWGDYMSDVAESTVDCIPESFGTMSPFFFVLCVAFSPPPRARTCSSQWIHSFVSVGLDVMVSTERFDTRGCSNGLFLYYCRYITVTTFLLLNLFIGVIVNSMMETKAEAEKKKAEAKSWAVATRLQARTGGIVGGVAGSVGSAARKATKGIASTVGKGGHTDDME